MPTAGVLLFIHEKCGELLRNTIVNYLNKDGRVSDEVLRVYWVKPTREDVTALCNTLKTDPTLKYVELIEKLRANNALRDLTAPWRLQQDIIKNFYLLVGLETINPLFRHKYPLPNLTLQAGSLELNESTLSAALREVKEEVCITIDKSMLHYRPICLLRGGMVMYPCYIFDKKHFTFANDCIHLEIQPHETNSVEEKAKQRRENMLCK